MRRKIQKILVFLLIFLAIFLISFEVFYTHTKTINKDTLGSNLKEAIDYKKSEIVIMDVNHLDPDRGFISNIYEQVKALDDVWSEAIPDGDYVRVNFEENLTSNNDITLYPRVVSGNPKIEIYEVNKTEKIAELTSLKSNEYNKVLLANLQGKQDTFDLRVVGGSVEFDYITDPVGTTLTIYDNCNGASLDTSKWTFIRTAGSVTATGTDYLLNHTTTAELTIATNITANFTKFRVEGLPRKVVGNGRGHSIAIGNGTIWHQTFCQTNTGYSPSYGYAWCTTGATTTLYRLDNQVAVSLNTSSWVPDYASYTNFTFEVNTSGVFFWVGNSLTLSSTDARYPQGGYITISTGGGTSNRGSWNINNVWNYTDTTPPVFTTIPANSSFFYGNQSLSVEFAATDETSFGSYSINDTRFAITSYSNGTGILKNATQMAVGNYEINVTINDGSSNINWTRYKVQINKSNYYDCGVYFNATSPITYPDNFIVYTNCSSIYTLYINGTQINNASTINSGASYYNLTVQRTDTANYTNTVMSQFFTVNPSQEKCQVLFNETSPLVYPKTFLAWANCTSAFVLARNGTTIGNNTEQALATSAYNFSMSRNDTTNYTFIYNETQFRILNTCSCPGLNTNWLINMADFCNISATCNLSKGNISFMGTGETRFDAAISCRNLKYPTTGETLFIKSNAIIRIG